MDSIASGAFITGFIKCSFKVLVWLSSFFSDSTSLLMIIRPSVLLCSFLLRIPFSAFTTSILSCPGNVNKPFFLSLYLPRDSGSCQGPLDLWKTSFCVKYLVFLTCLLHWLWHSCYTLSIVAVRMFWFSRIDYFTDYSWLSSLHTLSYRDSILLWQARIIVVILSLMARQNLFT